MSKETINSFAGKRALITGASSGLGLEFADILAAQKVNLVLVARGQESMEKLASDLRRKYGVDVLVEAIDLASPGAASRLKSSLDAKSVAIDILLNNAGYGLHGDFQEMPIDRTVNMIQLNITTLTELTYLFGRDMAKRRSGHISFSSPASWPSKPFPATRPMRRPRLMCSPLARPCMTSSARTAWS
jgi:short-subunit dehydrogenase